MDEQLLLGEDDSLVALRIAWEKALDLLAPNINRPSFESFFRTVKPLSMDNGSVTLGASSELAKIFLEKYADQIRTALESTLEQEITVTFNISAAEHKGTSETERTKTAEKKGSRVAAVSLPLNDKYTFPTFIEGPGNRMAFSIAQSIAWKPGKSYNPFFIYGGPGLGKTHLLQAIGNYVLTNHPKMHVAYVSGEQFTSDYVAALREHKSEDFRRNYRTIDIWLLDDVQFLIGKDRTKEEFFHTFNALHQLNKQIILSSDRSPRDMSPLDERLISRFESGVVADIAPPDLETRIAILQQKAAQEQADVPMCVLECIADIIRTNVRALEGALITLIAYSSVMKTPLTIETTQQVLERYLNEKRRTEISPETIQRIVAKLFCIEMEDISGKNRSQNIVCARHVAIYLTRELTDLSIQRIGKIYGGRNHSTIIHACDRIKTALNEDINLREQVTALTEDLKAGLY